ncbi:MAG: hypothetical protein ACK5FT_09655 [Sphingomonadales bacterium]|jgi:hypothetical protein
MRIICAFILTLVFLPLLNSCKEVVNNTGNPVPRIALVKIEPTQVKQFTDSLKITFNYEDGDGDLGNDNADINSLEVQDERLTKADYYHVPPMAPVDARIRIKGQMTMNLRNVFLLGTGNLETTSFTVRIKDRAGNWSNPIKTPEITITR